MVFTVLKNSYCILAFLFLHCFMGFYTACLVFFYITFQSLTRYIWYSKSIKLFRMPPPPFFPVSRVPPPGHSRDGSNAAPTTREFLEEILTLSTQSLAARLPADERLIRTLHKPPPHTHTNFFPRAGGPSFLRPASCCTHKSPKLYIGRIIKRTE